MDISCLKISGSEAELLAGLDRLNPVSTYMSNEGWRDRQILHIWGGVFFGGGVFAHPLQEIKSTITKSNILTLKKPPLTRWSDNTIGPKRHLALCAQNASDNT
jgi:hypothetical protein